MFLTIRWKEHDRNMALSQNSIPPQIPCLFIIFSRIASTVVDSDQFSDKHGGFHKSGYPKIIHFIGCSIINLPFYRMFNYKPSILGYLNLWKPHESHDLRVSTWVVDDQCAQARVSESHRRAPGLPSAVQCPAHEDCRETWDHRTLDVVWNDMRLHEVYITCKN